MCNLGLRKSNLGEFALIRFKTAKPRTLRKGFHMKHGG